MLISKVAIRRPILTAMVVLAVLVFGLVAFSSLGVDLLPKIEFPVVTVVTELPGADPETVENRVTDIIEEAVNTLSGIKSLRSTSADGVSQVVIEFELEKKVDVAFQEVQARVNGIKVQLPTDVKEPVVDKMDLDAAPILTVIVSGDKPPRELTHIADKIVKERLQRIRDVGSAKLIGGRDRKIWLWLDPTKLKAEGLTVRDVRKALEREHVEQPGGRVETGPTELAAKTKAEFQSAKELNQLIITTPDGGAVRMADVGYAEDGLEEQRTYAQKDSSPAIALEVRRQSGTNTVAVARAVKAEVALLNTELAPQGVSLAIAVDSSLYIEQSVSNVLHHLIEGGLAAIVIVLLFLLNFRSTLISGLVLPTSVIAAFMLMAVMGFTINVITLMALSLAIGLLIDDAIVVQESIMRHVQSGKPAAEAAEFATTEIGLAVLAATFSVVSVFVPTAFTRGLAGRIFFPFGMTIAFAVLLSMLISFTVDPMLSSRLLRKRERLNPFFQVLENLFKAAERRYEKLLGFCLGHRWAIVLSAAAIFVVCLFFARTLHTEFQPVEDQSEFNVTVRAPLGASLDRTRGIMEQVRQRIDGALKDELEYTFYKIGATELQKVNEGEVYVKLKQPELRKRGQVELMEAARKALADIKDGKVSVQLVNRMGGSAFRTEQVQFALRGPDFNVLNDMASYYTKRMRAESHYVDVDTTFETGKPELDIVVQRDRAADLGVSPSDIAETVRAAIGGVDIGKFKAGGDRYDIAVRFLQSYRDQPEVLQDLWVPSSTGTPVELRNVAQIVRTAIPVEINRYDRQREVTVLANLQGATEGDAKKEIDGWAKERPVPPGYSTGWSGMVEVMQETFRNLAFTMLLSIAVIYMVLAAQFESIVHPFTIMLTLPLAFIGALVALLALHMTMTMFTMIAFIFLLGLVTKNAILLIDYTNTLRRRDGLPLDQALKRAGPVRLRPILMTTMAMIAGMAPVAIGSSAMRRPMAVAIIGGLVTSTFLTLLVIPSVYSLLDPASEWFRRHVTERKDRAAPPAEPPAGH